MSQEWFAVLRAARAGLAAILLFAFSATFSGLVHAGQATLAWNPSTDSTVVGYNVYYGTSSRTYSGKVSAGKLTTYTVNNLNSGTKYFFAVTAYNSAGLESGYSNEATVTIPAATPVLPSTGGVPWKIVFGSNSTPTSVKPVASFNASATSGTAPLATVFTSTSTGNVTSYSWTFGDGTGAVGATVSKTYSSAGTYIATLTVTGSGGSSSSSKTISVAAPVGSITPQFTVNRQIGPAPLEVIFANESTGSITSYAWNFGDGTTSTLRNPTHTYTNPGVYSVTLSVSGSGGTKSITKSDYVKVGLENDLAIDFGVGDGVWQFLNNGVWSQVHTSNAKTVTFADVDHNGLSDKVVDFGAKLGIWTHLNNATWVQLHTSSASWIVRADLDDNGMDDLVVDFGAGRGIWGYYNGGAWRQIFASSARRAVVADIDHNGRDDVVADFGATTGVWAYMNGTMWKWLDQRSPDWMAKVDLDDNGQDDLAMSFGAGTGVAQAHPGKGLWAYMNGTSWKQIDARAVASTRGLGIDIDHNGRDDLVVDYGDNGLWVFKNTTAWTQLHSMPAKSLTGADLDSNQQADLVVDFGSRYGIHVLMNGQSWKQIHATTASSISAGQIDAR